MGNYTIFWKFENPRSGRQARNFSENDPKILDLKSPSEQIIFRKLSLGAPDVFCDDLLTNFNLMLKMYSIQKISFILEYKFISMKL